MRRGFAVIRPPIWQPPPSVIGTFDEVDVGINGGTAQIGGQRVTANWVKNNKSLLSLTNRQVAAQTHQHILVYKTNKK